MAATFSPNFNILPDFTGSQIVIQGTIALTANYGGASSHGDTLSFLGFDIIKSSNPPIRVVVYETPAPGVSASGYVYVFLPGTTQGNGVLQVFKSAGSAAPLVEYTEASAYDAGLLAAVINCTAYFQSV